MKRLVLTLIVSILLLASSGVVAAAPPSSPGKADRENAEISLVVFVDYASVSPFPGWGTDENETYKTHADAKWVVPAGGVAYTVYTGGDAPTLTGVLDAVEDGFEAWDGWVDIELFAASENTGSFPGVARDKANKIGWKSIDGSGRIIAATYVWFNMKDKKVVEFDMVFDSDDPWGIGASDKYDIQNIATHEAGHTLFLDDLYMPYTSELTMHGYVDKGETKKQTLGKGDVLGVQELYGSGPTW